MSIFSCILSALAIGIGIGISVVLIIYGSVLAFNYRRYRYRAKYLKSLGFMKKERYERVDWCTYRLVEFYHKPKTNQHILKKHLLKWSDSEIYETYNIDVSGKSLTYIV